MDARSFFTGRHLSKFLAAALLSGAAFASTPASAPAPVYYLTTGHTGAQTQIDLNHSTTWSLIAALAWSLGGGDFPMKDGTSSTADVTLSAYDGTGATGSLEPSLPLSNSNFCTLQTGTNC